MIFKIESGKDVFELNPELKAVEAFAQLTPRQMTYVILATDYKSPYRKLPLLAKKEQAAISAGYKLEKDGKRLDMNGRNLIAGKVPVVEGAINRYRELQKDEDYETLLSITSLISQVRELNNKPNKDAVELAKTIDMNLKISKLVEEKKKIEELLEMREEAPIDPTIEDQADPDAIDESSLPILSRLNQGLL